MILQCKSWGLFCLWKTVRLRLIHWRLDLHYLSYLNSFSLLSAFLNDRISSLNEESSLKWAPHKSSSQHFWSLICFLFRHPNCSIRVSTSKYALSEPYQGFRRLLFITKVLALSHVHVPFILHLADWHRFLSTFCTDRAFPCAIVCRMRWFQLLILFGFHLNM